MIRHGERGIGVVFLFVVVYLVLGITWVIHGFATDRRSDDSPDRLHLGTILAVVIVVLVLARLQLLGVTTCRNDTILEGEAR